MNIPFLPALLCSSVIATSVSLAATSITTPVGAIKMRIAPAPSFYERVITSVSFPLESEPALSGKLAGVLTGVSEDSLTDSSAGWTPGALSNPTAPCLIKITSGNAAGRIFLISNTVANTAGTVTIANDDFGSEPPLASLGVVVGDRYRLLQCDTLLSAFGTPETTGIQGGATRPPSDIVTLFIGGNSVSFFYKTTAPAGWVGTVTLAPADNTPIPPDSMALYSRVATTPLSFWVTGTVPNQNRRTLVRNSGVTNLSNFWPVDTTLATSGISSFSGWKNGTSTDLAARSADQVSVMTDGAWVRYYFDGTNWRSVGVGAISNAVSLKTGSGFRLTRPGLDTTLSWATQTIPYAVE